MACPENREWNEESECVQIDECARLKNSCGPMGLCTDLTGGYRCVCEDGFELHRASDISNEWICGKMGKGVCSGATCGSYGVCVDLSKAAGNFDTGHVRQEERKGEDTYRCSCAHGYEDNGTTCVPLDCGPLKDDYGTWSGSSEVGSYYTLTCYSGSFIWGGALQELSSSCPTSGRWKTVQICIDNAQAARDAAEREYRFWLSCTMSVVCVICAALAAGLTMGLVSIEPFEMRMLLNTRSEDCADGEERQKLLERQVQARRLLPVLEDHHLLLVTLLLLNSVANEALPIFLDEIVPPVVAVLLSVSAVLVFGEILPSAVFTGPSQLRIAAALSNVVRSLQFLFFPIAWPIARLLDFLLHDHEENAHERYSRAELRAVLALHAPKDDTIDASREEISKSSSQEHRPLRAKRRTSLVAELLSKDHMGATSSLASSVSPACLPARGPEFSDPWVVPETCLAAGKPTIDSMEFALLLAAMTMRETPLHLCGAMTSLESSQIVSAISSVSSVCEGIMHREITSEWLVVVHEAGSHQEGQTGGEPQNLRRNHVLGVLPLASLLLAHQHAEEEEVGNYFKDVFRIPVWLQSKESTLAGYRELVRARGSGGPPGRGRMPLGLVIGSEMGNQGEGEACSSVSEIVLGSITLEDLAVAMALRRVCDPHAALCTGAALCSAGAPGMGGVGIRRGAVVVGACCGAAAALFVSRHPTFNDAQQQPHATKRRPKPPDGAAIAGSGRPASAVAVRLAVSK
eukprot:CAMPEP_0177308270 /NCGR_PEP_ID=MMETSP0368-20130122/8678_1 /TAXON_ID=447022 ORGANISM="Scrippsiella hangoei-like, Strain SHHI-4" /NCGR_SAMPLE_ID=MMETSP0368 /ASSEMBLY_ACC=CAM_ASM_000363 /LENGTH=744 /DNA_ID=CAMNT_0018767075 /DNA_START=199 /DNA_END=2432 /DNA_ORIENTATION=-